MRPYQAACIVVAALLLLAPASTEAKRRKHKGEDRHDSQKSKSKVKWSSSSDLSGGKSQVSTEEHGYYVKRTFTPLLGGDGKRRSPPYLAIPIAWFGCESSKPGCQVTSNSAAINSPAHALSEGYLCDDDCEDGYEPICGQTANEVAVFYNKCKLNVAKCRTHGLWTDLPYDQCQQKYPKETAYTDKKFRCSPYFRDNSTAAATAAAEPEADKESKDSKESNESSEEKTQDKKNKKNKLQPEEPIVLSVPAKASPVPVPLHAPKPAETIAMPPMPVKAAVPVAANAPAKPAEVAPPKVAMEQAEKPAAAPAPVPLPVPTPATPLEQSKPKSEKDKLKYVVS